jgi:hypothetical protein
MFNPEGEGEMSEPNMLDPTPELPDDTPIGDVELPTRIRNVLEAAGQSATATKPVPSHSNETEIFFSINYF